MKKAVIYRVDPPYPDSVVGNAYAITEKGERYTKIIMGNTALETGDKVDVSQKGWVSENDPNWERVSNLD